MTTFEPPKKPVDPSLGRLSYMSNVSNYSGVVTDAIPISFHNRSELQLASQEEFHTPLSSPMKNDSFTEIEQGVPATFGQELSLSSPPKDITTVSNYDSSLDSDNETHEQRLLNYNKRHTSYSPRDINKSIVANIIQNLHPIEMQEAHERVSSLTSHSTENSIPRPVINDNIIRDISDNHDEYKRQSTAKKHRLSSDYFSKVPTKNVTLGSPTGSQGYFSASNSYFGTGAYSNSYKAGEALSAPRDTSSNRKSFISNLDIDITKDVPIGSLRSPNSITSKHSRSSSIHNSGELNTPGTDENLVDTVKTTLVYPASSDQDIPPRSPNRPSPTFDSFQMGSESFHEKKLLKKPPPKNNTEAQSMYKDLKTPLETIDFDSVSFTSLDNKTMLNTMRNSDLRSINEESHKGTIPPPKRPISEISASSTRNLNLELRPPSDNDLILKDLDLTDDEQITTLINEMKLRSTAKTRYNQPRKTSLGLNHSSVLPRDTSFEVDKSDVSHRSSKVMDSSFDSTHPNESTPTVREKVSEETTRPQDSVVSTLPSPSSKLNRTEEIPFPKNSLNYHHQRYKSDAFDEELVLERQFPDRNSSVNNSVQSIQSESPLIVKKRITPEQQKRSVSRPLPTPPNSSGTTGTVGTAGTGSTLIPRSQGSAGTAVVLDSKSDQPKSFEDLTAEVEKQLNESRNPEEADFQDITFDSLQPFENEELESSTTTKSRKKKKSKVKPFNYKTVARMLEATEGTAIGQEFNDLQLPVNEKRLLEKLVDALSRLTADMIADPARYDEGINRLNNALRALEGFK